MSITRGRSLEDYMFRRVLQTHIDTILKGENCSGPEFGGNVGLYI